MGFWGILASQATDGRVTAQRHEQTLKKISVGIVIPINVIPGHDELAG